MRFRIVILALLLLTPWHIGLADSVTYGETTYVYAGDVQPAYLTLRVNGVSFREDSMEAIDEEALPGAVFGIYAKDADGEYVALSDPADPLRPLTLTSGMEALRVALPVSIDLYLKQLSAPQGYIMDQEEGVYRPLALPETVIYTNRVADMQGVWLTLTGWDGGREVPLAGVTFLLQGEGGPYRLITDEQGRANVAGLEPGEYTLRQESGVPGYHIDETEHALSIQPHIPLQVSIQNNQDAHLSLRTMGLSLDATQTSRLVPIERTYRIYDEDEIDCGTVASGEVVSLQAEAHGSNYTLRLDGEHSDGYADDTQAHMITLHPGQTAAVQTVAQSEKGFFQFQHVDAETKEPIAGGAFVLQNEEGATVLSFEADEAGRYAPSSPLPQGRYIVQMTEAAPSYLYTVASTYVDIAPFFSDEPVASASIESEAIPAQMHVPQVSTDVHELPSLFDKSAEIAFTLALFEDTPTLPVENIRYDYDLPEIEGLQVLSAEEQGASLLLPRRFALPQVQEVRELSIEGTVSYTYAYPVDARGTVKHVDVSAPFRCLLATFAQMQSDAYSLYGHVYDEENKPIVGMDVAADIETVQTDPYGAFAFRTADDIDAIHFDVPEGYGIRLEGNDAQVLPLRTIAGTVETHGPMEGYPVMLQIGELVPAWPDAEGKFVLTGILSSHDLLQVVPEDGILATVDQTGDMVTVHLYAEAAIHGVATDPDGSPVAGVQVVLEGKSATQEAATDTKGCFAFGGLYPDDYTLRFVPPEGLVLNDDGTRGIALGAGEQSDVTVSAMEASAIEGILLDGETPYPGATVRLLPGDMEAITDEAGHFAFEGLSLGEYTLEFVIAEDAVLMDAPGAVEITGGAQRPSYIVHTARPGQISGRIWYDANDDGYLSADEGGQAEVAITLYDAAEEAILSMQTGKDGQFVFDNLVPGEYRLGIQLPDGMIFARSAPNTERIAVGIDDQGAFSPWYSIASGQRLDGLVCGAITAGTVSGTVWEDINGDGLFEGDEPLLSGVTVTLSQNEQELQSMATDDRGEYRFANLRPGDYTTHFSLPESYMPTMQVVSADGIGSTPAQTDTSEVSHEVGLRRWRMDSAVHLGAQKAASLTAQVWIDADASGLPSKDAGYENIIVALYSMRGNSVSMLAQKATDADGRVVFAPLRPGAYQLRYHLPASSNWGFTQGIAERSGEWGISKAVTVAHGAEVDAEPVGLTELGSISGIAFVDADYDGLRGTNESGLAAQVALLNASGTVLREMTAAADGAYTFDGLTTGMYSVRFTLPDGYAFTKERSDAPSFNSDVPETLESQAQTPAIYLPSGEKLLIDAGGYRPASLRGSVWHDLYNTGVWSDGLPSVTGLVLTLMQNGEEKARATTDGEGAYRMENLAPGEYTLQITLEPDMRFSKSSNELSVRRSMMEDTEDTTAQTRPFTLENGADRGLFDFGVILTGTLEGHVTNMKTGAGLPGVTVSLRRDGEDTEQAVTDAQGRYRFENVRPGAVLVQFATPDGFALEAAEETPAAISIGQRETTVVDARCIPEASVEGRLWMDDVDGSQWTADKPPVAGLEVTLYRLGDGLEYEHIASTRTDDGGLFRFDKLLPGQYQLRYAPTNGMVFYNGNESKAFRLEMGDRAEYTAVAYRGASLSGSVWEDTNSDGLRAFNEPPMPDVRVALLQPSGSIYMETFTDASGSYRFDDVPPMQCAVRFTLPDAYIFSMPAEGGSVVPLTDNPIGATNVYTLSMGTDLKDIHAGAVRHTRIGDFVWLDENANGLQDTGEAGVGGIAIQLWRVSANGQEDAVAETHSDAYGFYRFDNVRPGTYRMTFAIGQAYAPTKQTPGLEQINSKLRWENGDIVSTDAFVAPSGRHQLTIDAGIVRMEMAERLGWFSAPAVSASPEASPTATAAPTPETSAASAENALQDLDVSDMDMQLP